MNPDDAIRAHIDLEAKLSIGMHFGTFKLTDEGYDEPLTHLQEGLSRYNVTNFNVLKVGETRKFNTCPLSMG
jgi:L-ascorbate metabolism protein UlaG (beta-lactamase superfamily)